MIKRLHLVEVSKEPISTLVNGYTPWIVTDQQKLGLHLQLVSTSAVGVQKEVDADQRGGQVPCSTEGVVGFDWGWGWD